jgi:5-methylcytosine-specific restriction endonuclease McrA
VSWWKGDDDAPEHDKIAALGPDGGWLWTLVNMRVSKNRTDGLVTFRILDDMRHRAKLTQRRADAAVALLVAEGLWHDRTSLARCERCKDVVRQLPSKRLAEGEHYVHDFLEYNPASIEALIPDARMKAKRKKELSRMTSLREAIWERDRGMCRYCGVRVDFADRKSDTGGQHDHVDPANPLNTFDAIVIACRGCNRTKGDRTPEEAGMTMLPIPPPRDDRDVTGRI